MGTNWRTPRRPRVVALLGFGSNIGSQAAHQPAPRPAYRADPAGTGFCSGIYSCQCKYVGCDFRRKRRLAGGNRVGSWSCCSRSARDPSGSADSVVERACPLSIVRQRHAFTRNGRPLARSDLRRLRAVMRGPSEVFRKPTAKARSKHRHSPAGRPAQGPCGRSSRHTPSNYDPGLAGAIPARHSAARLAAPAPARSAARTA
jgi:hypothetical protein